MTEIVLHNLVYTTVNHTGIFTDTKGIANVTGLKHSYIMQKCKRLADIQEIGGRNIRHSSYTSKQDKQLPMYQLDEAGTLALLLSFRGTKYDKLRLAVANQFVDQKKELMYWRQARLELKEMHRSFTDSVKRLRDALKAEGESKNYGHTYSNVQQQVNKAVTGQKTPRGVSIADYRDTLPEDELDAIKAKEHDVAFVIDNLMDGGFNAKLTREMTKIYIYKGMGAMFKAAIKYSEANTQIDLIKS